LKKNVVQFKEKGITDLSFAYRARCKGGKKIQRFFPKKTLCGAKKRASQTCLLRIAHVAHINLYLCNRVLYLCISAKETYIFEKEP